MNSPEILYPYSSVAIVAALFLLIIVCNELGFHLGRFVQGHTTSEIKTLTGSIQASILGLLALLLGFTFSMAMQRYDSRSMALIEEANAIGTAALRVQLLPQHLQQEANHLIGSYIDLRIAAGKLDITKHQERERDNRMIAELQHKLWALAVQATNEDPRTYTVGAFISSLNAVIDTQGKRSALLRMHVPESVMLLLFIVLIASGGMMGYSSGLSGKRIVLPVVLVSLLITLIVFLIIDLDRPRRGLIQVNQDTLLELKTSFASSTSENRRSATTPDGVP
jgi:hypothetical protein